MRPRSHTVHTNTSRADKIWQRWTDPTLWPEDDSDVEAATFDGAAPALGVRGTVTPKRGPKSTLTVTKFFVNRNFDLTTKLPLATMVFEHEMKATGGDALSITHRVTFSGPLGFLFDRLIGSAIDKGFPVVMANIVKNAA